MAWEVDHAKARHLIALADGARDLHRAASFQA